MSAARNVLRAATIGWFGVKLGILAYNTVAFPRLVRATPSARPKVSVLLPARNEAHNLPLSLPGMLAQGAHEVIVCDDESDDGTGDVARSLGATVIRSRPRPEGWHGKQWASQQLGEVATGDVLVFVDADIRWEPGALDALLAARERLGVDVMTCLPTARELPFGAHWLTPLLENLVLGVLPYALLATDNPDIAWGAGATMVVDRELYDRVGGYAGFSSGTLNDVAFIRLCKHQGATIGQVLGRDLVGIRMYTTYAESLAGYAKNIREVHLGSRALMVASAAWHLAAYTLPWLLPARTPADHAIRAASLVERTAVPLVTGRPGDVWEGLLSPLTPVMALPGWAKGLRRRRLWKDRPV